MEKITHPTAQYKIIPSDNGNRYRFFCHVSGMAVCTTEPIHAGTQDEELDIAWKTQGRQYFNHCRKCGAWVADVMYNAETLECVNCSVWEEKAIYCPVCGQQTTEGDGYCRKCGKKLNYEGVPDGEHELG